MAEDKKKLPNNVTRQAKDPCCEDCAEASPDNKSSSWSLKEAKDKLGYKALRTEFKAEIKRVRAEIWDTNKEVKKIDARLYKVENKYSRFENNLKTVNISIKNVGVEVNKLRLDYHKFRVDTESELVRLEGKIDSLAADHEKSKNEGDGGGFGFGRAPQKTTPRTKPGAPKERISSRLARYGKWAGSGLLRASPYLALGAAVGYGLNYWSEHEGEESKASRKERARVRNQGLKEEHDEFNKAQEKKVERAGGELGIAGPGAKQFLPQVGPGRSMATPGAKMYLVPPMKLGGPNMAKLRADFMANQEDSDRRTAGAPLTFQDNYYRSKIEDQKSQFMRFGQLPPGFEFLPGHMGRLGDPEAVAATGAMPLGGGYIGGGSFTSSGGSVTNSGYQGYNPRDPGKMGGPLAPYTGNGLPVYPGNQSSSGAWNTRADVPYNGVPASVRYNNPGAAWNRPRDELFGIEGYGVLKDGQNNRIGKFPTPVHGLSANMDLFATSKNYVGRTLSQATQTWRGGRPGNVPTGTLPDGTKFGPDTVLTPELLRNKDFMSQVFQSYTRHESGKQEGLSREQVDQAFDIYSAGGIENYKKQLIEKGLPIPGNVAQQSPTSRSDAPQQKSEGGRNFLVLPGVGGTYGKEGKEVFGKIGQMHGGKVDYLDGDPGYGGRGSPQIDRAFEMLKSGKYDGIIGYSAGGYNANHIVNDPRFKELPKDVQERFKVISLGTPKITKDSFGNFKNAEVHGDLGGAHENTPSRYLKQFGEQQSNSTVADKIADRTGAPPQVKAINNSDLQAVPGMSFEGPKRSTQMGAINNTDQMNRPFHIKTQVEMDGDSFRAGTGGGGKGSMPYGKFLVTGVHNPGVVKDGFDINEKMGTPAQNASLVLNDPKMGKRVGIVIHAAGDGLGTAGCLGIHKSQWPKFKEKMNQMLAKHGAGNVAILHEPGKSIRIVPTSELDGRGVVEIPAQQFIERARQQMTPGQWNEISQTVAAQNLPGTFMGQNGPGTLPESNNWTNPSAGMPKQGQSFSGEGMGQLPSPEEIGTLGPQNAGNAPNFASGLRNSGVGSGVTPVQGPAVGAPVGPGSNIPIPGDFKADPALSMPSASPMAPQAQQPTVPQSPMQNFGASPQTNANLDDKSNFNTAPIATPQSPNKGLEKAGLTSPSTNFPSSSTGMDGTPGFDNAPASPGTGGSGSYGRCFV